MNYPIKKIKTNSGTFYYDNLIGKNFFLTGEDDISQNEAYYLLKENQIKSTKELIRNIRIVTTYDCNIKCSYCWQTALRKNSKKEQSFINSEIVQNIIELVNSDYTVNNEAIQIRLTGGEPFLLKELFHFINEISTKTKKETHFIVNTNGTLPIEVSNINNLDNFLFYISIDDYRNRHRLNDKESFYWDKIVQNLQLLKEKKINVGFSSVINECKKQDFIDLISLAQEYSISKVSISLPRVINSHIEKIDTIEIVERLEFLYHSLFEKKIAVSGDWFRPVYNLICGKTGFCSGFNDEIAIHPNGSISNCDSQPTTNSNIKNKAEVESLINNRIKYKTHDDCKECNIYPYCKGGCYANIYNEKRCDIYRTFFNRFIKKNAELIFA